MPTDTGREAELYIGLMSGTSLDGVDAALVEIDSNHTRLIDTVFIPFDASLRAELLALNSPQPDEIHRAACAGLRLAEIYAQACSAWTSTLAIRAIGCHGQTLRHRPADGYTVQIGSAPKLAEITKTTVVADFRNRDIAAGGQGAPLVPAFHAQALASRTEHRVILNIGGIANITDLAPDRPVRGWDTGPGNLLMDGWIARHQGATFDKDGAWAASGRVSAPLLDTLLKHAFFSRPLPKSAGREEFNLDMLDAALQRVPATAPADVQRTLAEFTARTIAGAVSQHCPGAESIYVCGGGAHNATLLARLAEHLPDCRIATTAALGIDPDWVEAIAFAWLARQTLHHAPGNLPEVTGAHGLRVLGSITPA